MSRQLCSPSLKAPTRSRDILEAVGGVLRTGGCKINIPGSWSNACRHRFFAPRPHDTHELGMIDHGTPAAPYQPKFVSRDVCLGLRAHDRAYSSLLRLRNVQTLPRRHVQHRRPALRAYRRPLRVTCARRLLQPFAQMCYNSVLLFTSYCQTLISRVQLGHGDP